jgi:hypothetical protein
LSRAFIHNATPSIVALNRGDGDNFLRVLAAHGVDADRLTRLLEDSTVSRRQLIWVLGKVLSSTLPGGGGADSLFADLERGDPTLLDR